MTATEPRFRLLDPFTGWDLRPGASGVDGAADDRGLRLTRSSASRPQLTPEELARFLPPPWLARGDRPGEWAFLGTAPDGQPRVYRRDRCAPAARDLTPLDYEPARDGRMTALGYRRGRLAAAVATDGGSAVILWNAAGARVATLRFPADANPLPAFAPWGELVVVTAAAGINRLHRYDPVGVPRRPKRLRLGIAGAIDRAAAGADGAVWLATANGGGFDLWRVRPRVVLPRPPHTCATAVGWKRELVTGAGAAPARVRERARRAFPAGGPAVGAAGFCVAEPDGRGGEVAACFARAGGGPVEPGAVLPPAPVPAAVSGWAVTEAIDSDLPRCRWHRVRVEADLPPGTAVRVAVVASDDAAAPTANPFAAGFTGGGPFHATDWQREASADFLIDQPPGRYLFVALELRGTAAASPVVRRVRLDFPRATSLDRLPAVYREDPEAEDFTERFLSLFDSSLEDFDRAVERFPALLDPDRAPASVLPWLGAFLGVGFEPDWPPALRRELVRTASALARRRGTRAGLDRALAAVFGVAPGRVLVREAGADRPWGAVGGRDLRRPAVLGAVRLFPARGGRFRVGRSAVGRAALRADGDPTADVARAGAFRVRVAVPDAPAFRGPGEEALRRLVREYVPGHVAESVRVGGRGFVVEQRAAVGIDTVLGAAPPAVLGGRGGARGTAALDRWAVLRAGAEGRSGLRVGAALAGIHTVLE